MAYSLKKRIFSALAAGIMLLSVPALSGCQNENDENSKTEPNQVSEESMVSKFGGDTAVKSKNYKITLPVMQYLFNFQYRRYLSSYGQYVIYSGIDTSKSLREQYQDTDNKVTWYEYFITVTKKYLEQTLVLAEAANAEGMKLTDEESKSIEDNMETLSSVAEQESKTAEEYIKNFYGEGVTTDDIKEVLKITMIAQNYYNQMVTGYEYTDEEYEKYFEENKTSYLYADYLSFPFYYASDSESSEDSSTDEEAKKKAKEYADGLAQCKTEEEFYRYITQYLENNPDLVTVTPESSESSITEEDFKNAVQNQTKAALSKKVGYENTSPVGSWVFSDGRTAGETTVVEGKNDSYIAVLILKPAYRDEDINRNIRHILITSDTEGSEQKAKEKADQIYNEWKNGAATEETFAELANTYSEDPGSNTNGGLYQRVYQGQMVETFNNWLFDSERKPGDTGIVKTDYGYHIMYYVGPDQYPAWKMSADERMREESFSNDYEELKKKYPVEFDDDYINTIDVIETSQEESSEEISQTSAEG